MDIELFEILKKLTFYDSTGYYEVDGYKYINQYDGSDLTLVESEDDIKTFINLLLNARKLEINESDDGTFLDICIDDDESYVFTTRYINDIIEKENDYEYIIAFLHSHISEMKTVRYLRHTIDEDSSFNYDYLVNLPSQMKILNLRDIWGLDINEINKSSVTTLLLHYLDDSGQKFVGATNKDYNTYRPCFNTITTLSVDQDLSKEDIKFFKTISPRKRFEALLTLFPKLEILHLYNLNIDKLDDEVMLLLKERGVQLVEELHLG